MTPIRKQNSTEITTTRRFSVKDIDALAEDIVRTFELTRDGKEKKWFRKIKRLEKKKRTAW